MSAPEDPGFFKTLFDFAWAGVAMLVGLVWNKHQEEIKDMRAGQIKIREAMEKNADHFDERLNYFEKHKVSAEAFETNRKEVRDVQIKTFERLDQIGHSLARIEGKLEK